jgi:WD40 repeat protein
VGGAMAENQDGRLFPAEVEKHILSFLDKQSLLLASLSVKRFGKWAEEFLPRVPCAILNYHVKPKIKKLQFPSSQLDFRCAATLDGKLLWANHRDYTIFIWNLRTNKVRSLNGHADLINSIVVNPKNPNKILTCSRDKTLRLWDVVTGQCEKILTGHSESVTCAAFLNDVTVSDVPGNFIVSGSKAKSLRIWNLDSGKCIESIIMHENAIAKVIEFQGKIISLALDRTIGIRDLKNGTEKKISLPFMPSCLTAHPDGYIIFAVNAEIYAFYPNEVDTQKNLKKIGRNMILQIDVNTILPDSIYNITLLPDGRFMCISKVVCLWDNQKMFAAEGQYKPFAVRNVINLNTNLLPDGRIFMINPKGKVRINSFPRVINSKEEVKIQSFLQVWAKTHEPPESTKSTSKCSIS